MLKCITVALLLSPLLVPGFDDVPTKGRDEELEGKWVQIDGYTADGEQIDPEKIKERHSLMTIKGNDLTYTSKNGKPTSFKIAIDATKSPKELNRTHIEGPAALRPPTQGIYRVKDDIVEMSFAGQGEERPAELTPCPKGSPKRWVFGVYRREPEKPKP